jgi:hypothetical protein
MPNWKFHAFAAVFFVAFTFICLKYFNLFSSATVWSYIFLPIVFIYALLPDIDSEESVIRRAVDTLLIIGFIGFAAMYLSTEYLFYIYYSVMCMIIFIFLLTLKHRGKVHTIVFGALSSAPILLLDKYLALFCFVAFLSHLLIDGEFKFW